MVLEGLNLKRVTPYSQEHRHFVATKLKSAEQLLNEAREQERQRQAEAERRTAQEAELQAREAARALAEQQVPSLLVLCFSGAVRASVGFVWRIKHTPKPRHTHTHTLV